MAFLMPSGAGVERMTICGTGIHPVLPPPCYSVHQELPVSSSVLEATLERTIYTVTFQPAVGVRLVGVSRVPPPHYTAAPPSLLMGFFHDGDEYWEL